jgi:hypothetical protein
MLLVGVHRMCEFRTVNSTANFPIRNSHGAVLDFLRPYILRAFAFALVVATIGGWRCCCAEEDYELRSRGDSSPHTLRFDAFNLQVKVPREPWVQSTLEETGARARLVISRRDPNVVISLAAERVGVAAQATNQAMLAKSQAKIRRLPECYVHPGEEEVTANGIQGLAFRATASNEQGAPVHYAIWVATRNGYQYCVAAYGERRDRRAIDEALFRFLSGVKQPEPFGMANAVDGKVDRAVD